jgi:hypothetical protein
MATTILLWQTGVSLEDSIAVKDDLFLMLHNCLHPSSPHLNNATLISHLLYYAYYIIIIYLM